MQIAGLIMAVMKQDGDLVTGQALHRTALTLFQRLYCPHAYRQDVQNEATASLRAFRIGQCSMKLQGKSERALSFRCFHG